MKEFSIGVDMGAFALFILDDGDIVLEVAGIFPGLFIDFFALLVDMEVVALGGSDGGVSFAEVSGPAIPFFIEGFSVG